MQQKLLFNFSNFGISLIVACFMVSNTYAQAHEQASTSDTKISKQQKVKSHSLQTTTNSSHSNEDYLWMESLHQSISNSVYQSAVWFDKFFLDENTEQSTPRTNARIRFGWEPKARDWSEIDTRFRIKVKLPHFKDKIDLILSDDDELDQSNLPLDSPKTHQEGNEESFAAAVRFTHKKNKNRLLESRIGVSGGDIFVKARHKRRYTWDNTHSFRFEPSLYYFIDDGLGAKLLLEYDYQLNPQSQLRVNYSIRGSEAFSGIRWKHSFYKLTQLEQNAATILGLKVEGERNGENGFLIDNYTLSYRYRFNAIKSWLYFEVEPFLEWSEQENYTTTPGLALRVEGFFYKG
ncbi:hypothetical protein [Thalassotalea sp. SU-HH00458]|uniref:hypothetical protein n=1 Tax=Thalassotalea sp. SU-HH00458 TaxID=3127657 RepID=UPI003365409A